MYEVVVSGHKVDNLCVLQNLVHTTILQYNLFYKIPIPCILLYPATPHPFAVAILLLQPDAPQLFVIVIVLPPDVARFVNISLSDAEDKLQFAYDTLAHIPLNTADLRLGQVLNKSVAEVIVDDTFIGSISCNSVQPLNILEYALVEFENVKPGT